MNKINNFFYLSCLAMSVINYCSDSDKSDIDSETKTVAAFVGNISEEYKNRKIAVDWTDVIQELEKINYIYEKFETYSQVEGCFSNQKFLVFGSKFRDINTEDLIARINS